MSTLFTAATDLGTAVPSVHNDLVQALKGYGSLREVLYAPRNNIKDNFPETWKLPKLGCNNWG